MSEGTKIHWADDTVNPTMGCSGCELHNRAHPHDTRCYAAVLHARRSTNSGYSPNFGTVKLFPGRMVQAARWKDLSGTARADKPWMDGMPRIVFVSDMSDALSEGAVMGNDGSPLPNGVAFDYLKTEIIDAVVSENGKRHIWLWVTKRPARMVAFAEWLKTNHGILWPANLWPGTSVTRKNTCSRLDALMKVGDENTTRIVSVEPQWEDIPLGNWLKTGALHWVIAGGESKQVLLRWNSNWNGQGTCGMNVSATMLRSS